MQVSYDFNQLQVGLLVGDRRLGDWGHALGAGFILTLVTYVNIRATQNES